jgi:hypothetical protein
MTFAAALLLLTLDAARRRADPSARQATSSAGQVAPDGEVGVHPTTVEFPRRGSKVFRSSVEVGVVPESD